MDNQTAENAENINSFISKQTECKLQCMHLPASSSEFIIETTFSSEPNPDVNVSSFSRSTIDFTAEKLKPALSLIGEESLDDAKRSFIDLNFFPALEKGFQRNQSVRTLKAAKKYFLPKCKVTVCCKEILLIECKNS